MSMIVGEKGSKGILRSDSSRVRETWGLVRQLKMSEASLERRVKELEQHLKQENRDQASLAQETRDQYEDIIKVMGRRAEEELGEATEEMRRVLAEAGRELEGQRARIEGLEAELAGCERKVAQGMKWIEGFALLATLFVGLLNKWFVMMNIKCAVWELVEGLAARAMANGRAIARTRLRVVFWGVLAMVRLRKGSGKRRAAMANNCDGMESNANGGKMMFERLLFISAHFNPVVKHFIDDFRALQVNPSSAAGGVEAVLVDLLSMKQTELYPSLQFVFKEEGGGAEELEALQGTLGKYEQKLVSAGELLQTTFKVLQEKDGEIARLRREYPTDL